MCKAISNIGAFAPRAHPAAGLGGGSGGLGVGEGGGVGSVGGLGGVGGRGGTGGGLTAAGDERTNVVVSAATSGPPATFWSRLRYHAKVLRDREETQTRENDGLNRAAACIATHATVSLTKVRDAKPKEGSRYALHDGAACEKGGAHSMR